ncbi:MotA/TolQ/ExbB proton channel [Methylobacterium sp. 4-46]|uniref:MotA/TolQ/ExbB proton channel family protein n=1 Tax=unclassified Methylobacterium TaxID=2615210 RepID=UPI000152E524|nr:MULTISPECIES: MotA/TolQ/ExbB proton channel family protein [Methylobacterium]ACA15068.1 MotA/TolQ/ExbB proton channel [Methylobacterium sp. 4-46]WFT80804.1 MotA/TolQ/ExbB proton channel family protein [Methylobacterium nodulans]
MDAATFSPSAMFFQAGLAGRAVILTLVASSAWCWVLILESLYTTAKLRRSLRGLERGEVPDLLRPVVEAGRQAAALVLPEESPGEVQRRTAAAMERAAARAMTATEGGYSHLAVIASVAPFVGLLGTVWGIMNSFISIADAKDTSLAVVAPGIAEALATTAIGLIAAIPAAVAHGRLGAVLGRLSQHMGHLIEALAVDLVVKARAVDRGAR